MGISNKEGFRMSEEWKKEFFEWKDQIESKYKTEKKESLKNYIEFIRLQYKELTKHEEVCKKEDCLKIREMLCHILYFSDSRGEKPMEYSSMDGGELIHIASPTDSKLPELCKTCNFWFNMECALSPDDPISFMEDFKCDDWKPKEEKKEVKKQK